MSDDDVAARRAAFRQEWLDAVARATHLSEDQRRHCLNPDNLDAWWPPEGADQQEVA